MKPYILKLSKGGESLIDDNLANFVMQYKWYLSARGYAEGLTHMKIQKLHRYIMCALPGEEVDHINRNPLDNRMCNLRFVTRAQQIWNTKVRCDNISGYKGVTYYKTRNQYVARVRANGVVKHLGYFPDAVSAAKARDKAALEMHGEYACLNFPKEECP